MTDTAYETLPGLESDESTPAAGTVVMKFGGTSVADPEKIRRVAARLVSTKRAGGRVVAVVSAMGYHTDELLELAQRVSPQPKPRELDMLISVGERISCALVAMAISDLGTDAVSLTGSQAGIVTDTAHGKAKIVEVKADRIHRALDDDRIVLVAGFQGVSTDVRRDDARPRRLRHDRGRARSRPRRRRVRDLHGRGRRLHRRPARRPRAHRSSTRSATRRCSSWRPRARRCLRYARSSSRGTTACMVHVRSTFTDEPGTWIREEDERMLEKALISGVTHTVEEAVYEVDGVRPADLFEALAAAEVNVDTVIQMDSRIVFSAPVEDRRRPSKRSRALGAGFAEQHGLGKVSVVGAGMKSNPGVAARTFATLRELGVEPKFVATSPIKIAFYVPQESVERTVRALHEIFDLGSPQAERQHHA